MSQVYKVEFIDTSGVLLYTKTVHHIDASRCITCLYVCNERNKIINSFELPYKLNDVYALNGKIIFSYAGGLRLECKPLYR